MFLLPPKTLCLFLFLFYNMAYDVFSFTGKNLMNDNEMALLPCIMVNLRLPWMLYYVNSNDPN